MNIWEWLFVLFAVAVLYPRRLVNPQAMQKGKGVKQDERHPN